MENAERVAYAVIGAAIEVHRHLGPGMLESQYERAMVVELGERGLAVEQQVELPMHYKGVGIGDLRIDLLVESVLVVELKSVSALSPIHFSQVTAYLRASKLRLGLLINFNEALLRDGIRRVVTL